MHPLLKDSFFLFRSVKRRRRREKKVDDEERRRKKKERKKLMSNYTFSKNMRTSNRQRKRQTLDSRIQAKIDSHPFPFRYQTSEDFDDLDRRHHPQENISND